MSSDTESTAPDTDSNSDESHNKDKSKTVEEKYRKVDPREHILLRPDTYGAFSYNSFSIKPHHVDLKLTSTLLFLFILVFDGCSWIDRAT